MQANLALSVTPEVADVPSRRRMGFVIRLAGKRALHMVPVLLGVSFLTFSLMNLLPGGTALAILGPNATNQQIAVLNTQLGLNNPFWTRYGLWLWHVLHGNLGTSLLTSQPVVNVIGEHLPTSLELLILSIGLALFLAVAVSLLSARKPYGAFDMGMNAVSMFALSTPGFVLSLLLILVVSVKLGALPTQGFVPLSGGVIANLRTMILPTLATSFVLFATYSRILRSDLVDQLRNEEYVTFARAKGIGEWRILVRHVLRNSVFSVITVVGTNFGVLIGGVVVTESIFALPGMGELLQNSITSRDYPVVSGEVLVIAVLVVVMNLLTDVLYAVLDPRVRYGAGAH